MDLYFCDPYAVPTIECKPDTTLPWEPIYEFQTYIFLSLFSVPVLAVLILILAIIGIIILYFVCKLKKG